LLAEFKRRGYRNLVGLDPSPYAATAAQRLFKLEVRTAAIRDLHKVTDRFDLLLLTGVCEHIRDLETATVNIKTLLKPEGRIYIEVPDASRYHEHFSAPYQFFSMEHVNFFSPTSLRNFAHRHQLRELRSARHVRALTANAMEPTVGALYSCSNFEGHPVELDYDHETESALRIYLRHSSELEERVNRRIEQLVRQQRPLAVWGAGTHTLRLLRTSDLAKANLTCFIDSNVHYQNKTLCDLPVVPPAEFRDSHCDILISSQPSENEIYEMIKQQLHWPNAIYRLYGA
jgi:SAM-dependent methyltransferase